MSPAASDERRVQRFFVFIGQVLAATGWSTKFTSKSFSSRICWQSSGLSHGHTLDLQAVRSEHKITRKLNIFSRKRKVLAQSEPVRLWAALRRARWDKLLLSFICTASENKVIQVARKISNRYISILQKKRARLPTEVKVNQANIDRFEFRGRTHDELWSNLPNYDMGQSDPLPPSLPLIGYTMFLCRCIKCYSVRIIIKNHINTLQRNSWKLWYLMWVVSFYLQAFEGT